MVEPRISSIGPSQELRAVEKQKIQAAESSLVGEEVEQVVTERDFEEWCEEGFNPVAMTRRFQTLEETQKTKSKARAEGAKVEAEENETFVEEIHKIEETANRFQQNNSELRKQILLLLRRSISEQDSAEEILRKVLNFYPDFSLADEAMDFLLETSSGDLFERVRQAKEQLNSSYAREILAGRNISRQARLFSNQGLGSPTALRDMYRDITGNPRSPNALFRQLTTTYDFEKMRTVIRFLLHSLGADLKSKGPSIAREELLRLLEETRVLQGILGVFRFFQSRMKLLYALFEKNDLTFPSRINFELLAKQFMGLLEERYITPDKVLQIARKLGLSEEIIAQIIVITQMRDAVRQIAPRLYKNQQQKEDLLNALLETLDELEKELEEEEKEEDLRKKKKKG